MNKNQNDGKTVKTDEQQSTILCKTEDWQIRIQ